MNAIDRYHDGVRAARGLLEDSPTVRDLLDPSLPGPVMHRFLIEFSARGVRMTEPVEGWIRRAGERCIELGLAEVGRSLVAHSRHEAGHHEMLVEDTRHLVTAWNRSHAPPLDVGALLAAAPFPATQDYVDVHEETIASDTPFCQVAIELEIERMSVELGPPLIARCRALLGDEVLEGLSFVREHTELDVGHTALNTRMLERLLALRPDTSERLARAGSRALDAYVRFFGACLDVARAASGPRPEDRC